MIKRFTTCWKGMDFKAVSVWFLPLAFLFALFASAECALGLHSKDCVFCKDAKP